MASEELYGAVTRFENQHFPGQRSGYVDPGGAMLKKMEDLAKKSVVSRRHPRFDPDYEPLPPKWSLEVIHRDLLYKLPSSIRDPLESGGSFRAEARDALLVMAARHVKSLMEQKFTQLPWPVAMFGRAYVFKSFKMLAHVDSDGTVSFLNVDTHETEEPKLPMMRYGEPVDAASNSVITGKLDVLLLYMNGLIVHIPPYHDFILSQGVAPVPGYDRPSPIAGADRHMIK
jgi:hypothetical protein